MTALDCRPPVTSCLLFRALPSKSAKRQARKAQSLSPPKSGEAGARRLFRRWGWLLLLAACVILCHGCHAGDHDDDELIVFFLDR